MDDESVRTRTIVLCGPCGEHWAEGVEEAGCTDEGHEHQRFDVHMHRDVVTLPDGTEVVAVSFDPGDPYGRDAGPPDHGVYLDARWAPPWSHDLVDWPDFGLPADPAAFVATLERVLDRARRGERVEVGCLGGHGRTGTAIAALAVLAGHPADDAVAWTRARYCAHAVETPEQEALVAGLAP
jgi:hypothetical protein